MERAPALLSEQESLVSRYLSCLRVPEILVLQGSPLLGAAVALGHGVTDQLGSLAVLVAANVCLVAHIFALNDWSNLTADLGDPNKARDVFTARGVGRTEMGALTAALLGVSLVLLGTLGTTALLVGVGIAVLSALYSVPPFAWKSRPLFNSAAHLAGGTLHFLLGYALGAGIDRRGLAIAAFFAVTFTAGHLTQELRDYDGDVKNGTRTNAAIFGRRRTFAASVALFTLSHALLLALALTGTIPRVLALLAVLYPVHLYWAHQALADGLTFEGVCRLQSRYRLLYAVIGAALIAALWLI